MKRVPEAGRKHQGRIVALLPISVISRPWLVLLSRTGGSVPRSLSRHTPTSEVADRGIPWDNPNARRVPHQVATRQTYTVGWIDLRPPGRKPPLPNDYLPPRAACIVILDSTARTLFILDWGRLVPPLAFVRSNPRRKPDDANCRIATTASSSVPTN